MIDHQKLLDSQAINKLTPELKNFLNETRSNLKGSKRRKFMAKVVLLLGKGGQRRAERELGWDRKKTILKGTREPKIAIKCIDNFSGRGRHRIEQRMFNLLEDIKHIVNPVSQCDPTFCSTVLYSPLTAAEDMLQCDRGIYSDLARHDE